MDTVNGLNVYLAQQRYLSTYSTVCHSFCWISSSSALLAIFDSEVHVKLWGSTPETWIVVTWLTAPSFCFTGHLWLWGSCETLRKRPGNLDSGDMTHCPSFALPVCLLGWGLDSFLCHQQSAKHWSLNICSEEILWKNLNQNIYLGGHK